MDRYTLNFFVEKLDQRLTKIIKNKRHESKDREGRRKVANAQSNTFYLSRTLKMYMNSAKEKAIYRKSKRQEKFPNTPLRRVILQVKTLTLNQSRANMW